MTAWLVRGGRAGEREGWALESGVSGGGFREVGDLSDCTSREEVQHAVQVAYPDRPLPSIRNFAAQLWILRGRVEIGDLVVMPLKSSKKIALGRCVSGYKFLPNVDPERRHIIGVEWIKTDISRSSLKQDLLFSLGAFMTVCEIKRNGAEERLTKVLNGENDPGAFVQTSIPSSDSAGLEDDEQEIGELDIESVALDGIRTRLIETFQSHRLADVVAAILETRGLTCVVSPPGPDKGIDIVAGSGPLGLDSPRIVVQCKSSDSPVDTSVVQRLQGALGTIGAEQALLVAFAGLNKQAKELLVNQQFKVKVWTADDLVGEFLDSYSSLGEEIQEKLPLKKIWTLTNPDE